MMERAYQCLTGYVFPQRIDFVGAGTVPPEICLTGRARPPPPCTAVRLLLLGEETAGRPDTVRRLAAGQSRPFRCARGR